MYQSFYYSYYYTLDLMKKPSIPSPYEGQTFDIKKCHLHRKANSYGMPLNYNIKCDCCGRLSQKEVLTFGFSLVKLYYCGPQLAIYLTILKYLTILLFILCITNAVPLIIINSNGQDCQKTLNCASSMLLQYSIFNQFGHHKKIREENYIIIANFIACLVFWHIVRYKLRKIKTQIEEANFVPNQYVILCQLPLRNIQRNMIAESIEKWWRLQIKHNRDNIDKCFPDVLQAQEKKQTNLLEHQTNHPLRQIINSSKKQSSQFIQEILYSYDYSEFSKFTSRLSQSQRTNNEVLSDQFPTLSLMKRNSYCLVIFKKVEYSSYFISRNNPTSLEKLACFENFRLLYLGKKKVNVAGMLYPSQILWKNHHIDTEEQWKLIFLTGCFLLLMALLGSGTMILFCQLYKKYVLSVQSFINHIYYLLAGLLINLIILIGNKIITIYSQRQSYSTYVSQKLSYINRIVSFNICLILISPLIIFTCFNTQFLWQKNGFIETEVISLIIYMFAIQIQRYLSPSTLKMIQQYKKFLTQMKTQKISQKLANQKFNKPSHKIDKQYAAICTITFINFFLCSFAPYVTILSFLWMLFQFLIEKVNICYFYNEDEFHSQLLGSKMVDLIQYSFSFLIYGNMSAYIIRIQYFHEHVQIQFECLFTLLFTYSIFSILMPLEKINTKLSQLFRQPPSVVQQSPNSDYSNLKNKFHQLYEDFNEVLSFYKHKITKTKDVRKDSDDFIQSLSASLSLSLKQRLAHSNEPIISQIQQQHLENEEYFEYEKKINMKKTKPKVDVPRLFEKNKPFPHQSISLKKTQEEKK